jgi:hypothetical protein
MARFIIKKSDSSYHFSTKIAHSFVHIPIWKVEQPSSVCRKAEYDLGLLDPSSVVIIIMKRWRKRVHK